jgi:hypothetical protein
VRERLSADPPQLHSTTLDFTEHLRTALDGLEPAARRKGLMMHRALPNRSVSIEADPGALRLLVAALVNNAISSTEEGSITVSGRDEGNEVRLRVVDTGGDISKTLLNSLLDVEGAEEEDDAHEQHMAFVHRLSGLMQGSVEMESQRGKGTVFSVTLPRDPEAAEAPSEAPAAEAPPAPAPGGDGLEDESSWDVPDGETASDASPYDSPPADAENDDDFWENDSIFSTSPDAGEEADDEDDPDAFRSDPDSPFSF